MESDSHENELLALAETWFFRITVCLDKDRDFSNVIDVCKQQLECSLSTLSVIA